MSTDFDYYTVLGLTPQATVEEIREAFVALQSNFAPDERDAATNLDYKRILNAYEVLNDPERRATYDSLIVETTTADLDIQVKASRDKIPLSETVQLLYLLVDIHPPKRDAKQLPLNLCLVIDRSTSMQGNRLTHVKSAVELIVEKLTPGDTLSVISFSDRAEVNVPAGSVENSTYITSQVRAIQASGGTEIYQGLYTGVTEMRKVDLKNHTNHLILLTDGHTYGDAQNCLELAEKVAAEGIGFSAFGIGSEWNDQFLDSLVSPSGGQSGFIESPSEVIEYLQKRIKGLGAIYAQNLRLQKTFPKSMSLQYGFKLEPFAQPLSVDEEEIKLGNLEGLSPLSFLLEINVEPQPIETRVNIPLTFAANIPAQQMREKLYKSNYSVYVLADASQVKPPEALVKAVRTLNMYRMNEKVWEEVEAGRLDVAATRMKNLSTRLLQEGEEQLAHQATIELERIANAGTMSLEGRKKLKYGTRALINQTIQRDEND